MITNRIRTLIWSLALPAQMLLAQPAPPPLPALPALPAVPAPPAPMVYGPPAPAPFPNIDLNGLEFQIAQLQGDQARQISEQAREQARQAAQQARQTAEQFRFAYTGGRGRGIGDDGLYANGQRALDRSQWDEALGNFNRVAANGGAHAEGALY